MQQGPQAANLGVERSSSGPEFLARELTRRGRGSFDEIRDADPHTGE